MDISLTACHDGIFPGSTKG